MPDKQETPLGTGFPLWRLARGTHPSGDTFPHHIITPTPNPLKTMTTKEMQELLDAAKPSVIESLKKELTNAITWEAKTAAAKIIQDETEKWVREFVVPDVIRSLTESKDSIVSIGCALGPKIVDEVVKHMTDELSKKLSSSWERKKIFGALFD